MPPRASNVNAFRMSNMHCLEGSNRTAIFPAPKAHGTEGENISIFLVRYLDMRGRRNLLRNDREPGERARAERGYDRNVGGIAPACHQDAADTRRIVTRIERVPASAEISFEPGAEIHW